MKTYFLIAMACAGILVAAAQEKNFSYRFYGQIRTDLFYNSRSNAESVDGLFYMYPKNAVLDADGNDLNAQAEGNFYTMYTRAGLDVAGPALANGKIATSAKVELDFRGGGTNYYMVRLRQAYFGLAWRKSSLLVGQTWHPFYGDVAPEVLNLNMGAPYQPFSRAPQVRYRLETTPFCLTVSALWQSQYMSVGPKSNVPGETGTQKSNIFLKKGCLPELALNLDYKRHGWIAGAGVDITSLVPRTQSETPDGIYKVDERITGISAEAHLKYKNDMWSVAAKTVYGSNFTQASGVGGYGITGIDNRTGEQSYTPLRTASGWVNVAYGKSWRPAVFFGYLKNLGASEPVTGVLGTGVNEGLDVLATASAELTYNLPHWKFGVEYMFCKAWYGTPDEKAKMHAAKGVANHRAVFSALFIF